MALFSDFMIRLFVLYLGADTVCADIKPVLEPSYGRVQEGKNLTFSCTYNGTEWNTVQWIISIYNNFMLAADEPEGHCKLIDGPLHNNLHPDCKPNDFNLTLLSVTNDMHGVDLKCLQNFQESNISSVFVEVPVKYVRMSINEAEPTMMFNSVENETIFLECNTSESRPPPNIIWYIGDSYQNATYLFSTKDELDKKQSSDDVYNYTSSSRMLAVSKANNNKWIFCNSTNLIDSPSVSSKYCVLNVQYPPVIHDTSNNISVIKSKTAYFTYNVTRGNPNDTHFTWTRNVDNTVWEKESFAIQNVTRKDEGVYTLMVYNTMKLRNGTDMLGYATNKIYLEVLFPPEEFRVSCEADNKLSENISDTFYVIHETNLNLTCSANSKPSPHAYTWNGMEKSTNQTLIMFITKNHSGEYSCNASNSMKEMPGGTTIETKGKTYYMKVLYPQEISDMINIKVIQGNSAELKPNVTPGNLHESHLNWTRAVDNKVWNNETVLIQSVNRSDGSEYTLSVNNTMKPTCGTERTVYRRKSLVLEVLYPPENMNVSCMADGARNETVIDVFNITLGTNLTLTCKATSNPDPSYSWGGKMTIGEAKLTFIVNKGHSGNYTCTANNTMKEMPPRNSIIGTNSKTYYMNVLYPPEISDMLNITVIQGNPVELKPNVTPGNPHESHFNWTRTVDNKVWNNETVLIESVKISDGSEYTLSVSNTMKPTCGTERPVYRRKSLVLEVLYPPEKMNVSCIADRARNETVIDVFNITLGTNLTLTCKATSNPDPSYSWGGKMTIGEANLTFIVNKGHSGNYTCTANNTMKEMPRNTTEIGTHSKTYHMNVLYPPEIHLTDRDIIEGDDMNISCVNTPGEVSYQSINWTSNHTNITNNNILIIRNVTRKHAGNCTCIVNYTMTPTYGESITNIITGVVYLNVLYQAELSEFYVGENNQNMIVSVNESDSVGMVCILDSNPGSTMNISVRNQTVSTGKDTKTLTYKIGQSSCSDTGVYTCSGYNFLNKNHPSRHLQLFINCSPRKSSLVEVQQNLTLHNGTATFSFIALAYPPPTFKWWFRPDNSDFKEAGNGHYTTVNISENEMQINFTVVTSDYGEYVLTINNTFGSYQQSFFLLQADATNDKQNSPPGGDNAGQVAGGVIGGLLGIGAIVAAVFLVRRRGLFSKAQNDDGGHHEYQNVGFTGELKHSKRLPALPPDDESEDVHGDHRTIAQQQDFDVDEHPYLNTMELIDLMKKVNVSDLFSYVTSKSYQEFSDEFGKFPSGLMVSIPCTFASKPENAPFNRYQGIYPYDHSRVIISGQPAFFINASYIDGHSGKQQIYIASLGPTVKHTHSFKSFWNMVWHHDSDVIVMLTNLQEPSGMKCEKYWADRGTTRNIGDFTIQSVGEEVAADYKVRTFKVFKDDESRMVTQLHFTAWPDKKVPEDVTSLIEFRQRVKAAPTRSIGPLIVHCSAGVGRTGTFIALDRLIEEGKSKNAINVYDCVMNMRKQRVNMVQTLDQYVYLHQALVYCLVFDTEPVSSGGIEEYVKKTSNNVYSKMFQQLQQTVEDETIEEKEARARNGDMLDKNRKTADIPSDAHRIRLFLDKQMGDSDYINAVYLNGFKRLGHFIIAQSPLPTTLDDFVCLLYQANCCCIVSLDDYLQTGASNVTYLPPDNQPMKYGTFTISCTNLDVKSGYSVRKLKLGHTGQFEKGERIVYHFEFTGWKHDERTPKDPKLFVDFVKEVDKHATQLEDENSHVLVHCMTGSERSGLFCAVYNLMDKMEQERQISVVNMLRRIRARRKTAIPNMEQLKFCYQALNAFVKSYKI